MKTRSPQARKARSALLAALLLSACSTPEITPVDRPSSPERTDERSTEGPSTLLALAYYQQLETMLPSEIQRERTFLAAQPATPGIQLRTAMVLGHSRSPTDLNRALNLLEAQLKSSDPAALALQPLTRLLADHYSERQKLETQLEKQNQQLKESQRRTTELQEKLDALADIERTLPQRPRLPPRPGASR